VAPKLNPVFVVAVEAAVALNENPLEAGLAVFPNIVAWVAAAGWLVTNAGAPRVVPGLVDAPKLKEGTGGLAVAVEVVPKTLADALVDVFEGKLKLGIGFADGAEEA